MDRKGVRENMGNLFQRENKDCQSFRDALEKLPVRSGSRLSGEEWLAELPAEEAGHPAGCADCRETLEEFAETRDALAGIQLPEAGPWFTARVMAAIGAREKEEEADGVWISVRRLAPRLVAVSVLLLVVGGSWAVEQTRKETGLGSGRGGDMVFDSSVVPTWYDDGIGTLYEVRP